jgi:hypothetical protein
MALLKLNEWKVDLKLDRSAKTSAVHRHGVNPRVEWAPCYIWGFGIVPYQISHNVPGDLPIEQASKFTHVINQKPQRQWTSPAQALADEVIE